MSTPIELREWKMEAHPVGRCWSTRGHNPETRIAIVEGTKWSKVYITTNSGTVCVGEYPTLSALLHGESVPGGVLANALEKEEMR